MFRPLQKSKIDNFRYLPSRNYLAYKQFGRTANFEEYTDQEITEMYNGAYRDTNTLLVDGDYFINLNDVHQVVCVLQKVTFHKKLARKEESTPWLFLTDNIRTYYIHNYFLITQKKVVLETRHRIGRFLSRYGELKQVKGVLSNLFRLPNTNPTIEMFKSGPAPVVLYEPIRLAINRFFFNQDNHISDFIIEIEENPYAY